ncbi:MAG: hypothetical protein NVSMB10_05560 [Steroidobacteraceae bacterium]
MIGVGPQGIAMPEVVNCIRSLEGYVERHGVRLVRSSLPATVHGRMRRGVIVLRRGLHPEQELSTLVHELAHWLAHQDLAGYDTCTVLEYEAEAVEALVMGRLGFAHPTECPTDDLLSASVQRVKWASARICAALGMTMEAPFSEA